MTAQGRICSSRKLVPQTEKFNKGPENVGSQSHSLRQSFNDQLSLAPKAVKMTRGMHQSCVIAPHPAPYAWVDIVLSAPFFSEPPHFAHSVRNSQVREMNQVYVAGASALFEEARGVAGKTLDHC